MDLVGLFASPSVDVWAVFRQVQVNTVRTVVVDTVDNTSPAGDGKTSLLEALQGLQAEDLIRFNLQGLGPHVIKTPLGGYPMITNHGVVIDGLTQPGAAPNTNGILDGNNSQLKIVLDSTSAASKFNPENPDLPLVASTRLPYPGYGDSENAILGILGADNVTIRGLVFLGRHPAGTTLDPSVSCIALVDGAVNCKVQGNWFGLAPDGSLKGTTVAVAGYRHRVQNDEGQNVDTYSEGLIVGTDSDGVNDRAEFNLICGMHIGLDVELPHLKVQGNYFNLRPDGITFLDVNEIHEELVGAGRTGNEASVENLRNGRRTDGSVIGTDGDGSNDAQERNVFNTAYYDNLIQFDSNAPGLKVSGNYFGVGVNGISTPIPPLDKAPNLIDVPVDNADVQVGSNGDRISDQLEGNVVVGITGDTFFVGGKGVPVTARANTLRGNGFIGFPFADGSNNRPYDIYYSGIVADPTKVVPVIDSYNANLLTGSFGLPTEAYPLVEVDVYLADPLAPENPEATGSRLVIPGSYLGTLANTADLDPAPEAFALDLAAFNVPQGANLCVVVSYQKDETSAGPGRAVSSPVSNAVFTGGSVPIGAFTVTRENNNARLTWTGGAPPFQIQGRPSLTTGSWSNVGAPTADHTALVPITDGSPNFFQVRGQ